MNGMHDLGGRQGFGPVRYSAGQSPYKDDWNWHIQALSGRLVALGIYNVDEYRHAIERMDARHYLLAGYFERVVTACATLMVEKGVVNPDELEQRAGGHVPLSHAAAHGQTSAPDQSRFVVGDRVRVRASHVLGHSRAPAYIHGKTGNVIGISARAPFPGAAGHGELATVEQTYEVQFDAAALWPDQSDAAQVVVTVFRSYLDREVPE
jgi:nitrile hydratase beta subunit